MSGGKKKKTVAFDVDGLRWIVTNHEALGLKLADIPIDAKAYPVGCVVGAVTYGGHVSECVGMGVKSPWFFGPVGWLLSHHKPLADPVPMKGYLGLFEVELPL